jgi:DNA repair ATPase RecN
MKQKILNLLITALFFVTLSFNACNTVNNAENIKKIDSLKFIISEIDRFDKQVNEIKTTNIYDEVKNNLAFFAKNMKQLPENPKHLKCFNNYSDLRRDCKNYFKNNNLKKDLEYSKKQLTNLERDITNNAITNKQFLKYFTSEYEANHQLLMKYKNHIKAQNKIIKNFNNYNPVIKEMIDSLINLKNNN